MAPLPTVALLLLLLLGIRNCAAQPSCIARDRDALLEFKAGLKDPGRILQTWTASGNCCQFRFVTCNAAGEVSNLTLRSIYPDDCEECNVLEVRSGVKNLIGRTLSQLAGLVVLDLRVIRFRGDAYPVGLGALKKLKVLALAGLELQGPLPSDLGQISALTSLEISNVEPLVFSTEINPNFTVTGSFPTSVCSLEQLEVLDIGQEVRGPGQLTGPIPSCIGDLQKLRVLSVETNQISGQLPSSLASLTKLEVLRVTNNKLTGSIPSFLGSLASLRVLNLDGNDFTGSIPISITNLALLTDLRLGGFQAITDFNRFFGPDRLSQISGSLPTQLGKLTNLQTLVIRASLVSGPIPTSIGQLKLLSRLDLDKNRLTGSIPAGISNTNVSNLDLSSNKLTGSIPQSFTSLTFRNLNLSRNELQGSIPLNLDLTFDGAIDLSFNRLTGKLDPTTLIATRTVLLNNNLLTDLGGPVPTGNDFFALLNVQIFDIHSNRFAGPASAWLFQLSFAFVVDISDNGFTSLPASIDGTTNVRYLNISSNSISGNIPDYLVQGTSSNAIDFSKNKFTGTIPPILGGSNQPFLDFINLGDNQLTGTIPPSLFSSFPDVIILNKNQLTGIIPDGEGSQVLKVFDVSDNQLQGPIPNFLFEPEGVLVNLQKANLGNNRLSGVIPNFTANCPALQTLILEKNQLTGPVFPNGAVLKNCRSLEVYDVSDNSLTGTIPSSAGRLDALRVLDVSNNSVTGNVQSNLQNLKKLQVLDLSSNQFKETVPLSKLSSGLQALRVAGKASPYTPGAPLYQDLTLFESTDDLRTPGLVFQLHATGAIDLSKNSLKGGIDASIGNLKGLHLLDLSDNTFSGGIPASIADITDLEDFDVSNNKLSGRIPAQLSNFPAADFVGNPLLCGSPLATPCP